MLINKRARLIAIGEALLANLIWASTYVLVKIGLNGVGPLTLGGLRYFAAFLLLMPFILPNMDVYRTLSKRMWVRLIAIGVLTYTIGNGALFWGLQFISATAGSFETSLTPLLVLFLGIFWLREVPTSWQWLGIIVVFGGSLLFFSPGMSGGEPLGLMVVGLGLFGIAVAGIISRAVAKERRVDTLFLTAIPLGFGGGLILLLGLLTEPVPHPDLQTIGVIAWLAVVNTAMAYMLYNHSLQVLTALEVNIMMNLTPLATAALAWFLLAETLDAVQIIGMIIVIAGVGLVQWRGPVRRAERAVPAPTD
jgi:drug/metabolite transporter (DMT)-like permease